MPRRPEQFDQLKDERKASILKHALPLFALKPQKDITIDLISQSAKCSHGLVYHYFKSTDEIFEEIKNSKAYLSLYEKLTAINSDDETYSQIVEIVKRFLEISSQKKDIVAYALIIINDDSKKSFYSSFLKLIEKGQNERVITGGNPKDIADCFFLLLKGIYCSLLNQKHSNVRVPSIDNILNIFKRK